MIIKPIPPAAQRGFTLLEMLVVLVLVALISTLLLEGISQVLLLRERFLGVLQRTQQGAVQAYWFRSSVAGLLPDYPTERPDIVFQARSPQLFEGQSDTLSGLTLAALDANGGVPTPFSWRLLRANQQTTLQYQNQAGEYWTVMVWPGEQGEFRYQDKAGKWYEQWPPALGLEPPQLPSAVLLTGLRQQQAFTWLVPILGREAAALDYRLLDE
jgi:general secretion pathway protein J